MQIRLHTVPLLLIAFAAVQETCDASSLTLYGNRRSISRQRNRKTGLKGIQSQATIQIQLEEDKRMLHPGKGRSGSGSSSDSSSDSGSSKAPKSTRRRVDAKSSKSPKSTKSSKAPKSVNTGSASSMLTTSDASIQERLFVTCLSLSAAAFMMYSL
mmetsp:Transcript_22662/g.34567  ORF Transcript_22662/g.34567 Transcript_22662/m.34567 type:complete len:156 (+) Transcript_22662:90-557(+)|eukprot:CAMPEP_0194122362 /NCGR_PEP_ID=MMETSP0150-20130528/50403_1 /TAXON_ID=122233 /ORGANISM="Chaetoceros debilis, Strain MM31A-1" /LENGTH=155 /DNA_ID=CAMNT_0038815191 /DNA_START=40 /DNA_END=507 /DNA_ORIENTATION=+